MTRINMDIIPKNLCYPCHPCSLLLVLLLSLFSTYSFSQTVRQDISLNNNWRTIATDSNELLPSDYYRNNIDDRDWKQVNVPHNWDAYEGYRRLLHGNRHGDSWYRKTFTIKQSKKGNRFFLFFEGVNSYATVFLNEQKVGGHAGGRTTFTLDVTDHIKTDGTENKLAVRAWHPSGIKDLPWVCGGCSEERGFSEGSQPMGIFRPVHLIVTGDVRIEPFGVQAGSEKVLYPDHELNIGVTFRNYSNRSRNVHITNQLINAKGKVVLQRTSQRIMPQNSSNTIVQDRILVNDPVLWSVDNPYLYRIVTTIKEGNKVIDQAETEFGFRWINWRRPLNRFRLNDNLVFINGVAEYEHLLGQSHAFSEEQVRSRINWVKKAGFNAFRDAHQPHNLLYGQLCDREGILWWTQFSAHVWYDTPEFKENFKKLLIEWVLERRNSPSIILWGLQNESQIPEDFAQECSDIIRALDYDTRMGWRRVTTCNGGSGTDWDVPQNWTGTYGGNPDTYASDIKKQVLIGEYGAWRTIDLHTEGPFVQNGILSEDRMTLLMEQKVRLAESVKDSCAGQFFWLLTSHDNPGRVQGGEGKRELDRIGPVNYKGLLTPWEEPLDVFYMFRANYASKEKEPMVYIVSHTWPDRWDLPGNKDSIIVYSNCDEVELFNDVNGHSLGTKRRNGIGTHFQWDSVDIKYNVLYAVGYVYGKAVARDTIVLRNFPVSPGFNRLYASAKPITKPKPGYHYIYRVNCGGPDYKDENDNTWSADRAYSGHGPYWGSVSWSAVFEGMPSFFASQRRTYNPIKGTKDWKLFQDFRYGKDKLYYRFPLPDGEYLVELYFIEPWLGVGGGMNAKSMRLFDVAINGKRVLNDLDIWKEAGTNTALKKTVRATITGGEMIISFPESKAGQAIISAIAIASVNKKINAAPASSLISDLTCSGCKYMTWLDTGDKLFSDDSIVYQLLPSNLYGADWLQVSKRYNRDPISFTVLQETDVFVAWPYHDRRAIDDLNDYEDLGTFIQTNQTFHLSEAPVLYKVSRKRFPKGSRVTVTRPMVMLLPAEKMQPAYDLKSVKAYRANGAAISGGALIEQFNGRECVVVKSNNEVFMETIVEWGLADIYSFTVKYHFPADTVRGKVQLISYGQANTVLLEQPIYFTNTKPGKWNSFTFNSGSMINAGRYGIKIMIENAEGLAISGIDVQ
jgi:beta-galactosidase